MRTVLSLILVLSGCLPPRLPLRCNTECGMRLDLSYAGDETLWNCESLQAAETRAIRSLAVHARSAPGLDNPGLFCVRLSGYVVIPHDSITWNRLGIDISGLTYCDIRNIEVGSSPPGQSAFTHEVAHALQGCFSGDPSDPHSGWGTNGIQRAIDATWE
jgi:hypothetical protein